MRPLMVYLYLTSVHLMGGCLMGVYLGRVSPGKTYFSTACAYPIAIGCLLGCDRL